ncbi:hypothetical protein HYALB_00012293 [Hymenoscyphus albidus]|uniref:Uncharacterized protein n=1 Tax=Hymenoscyphus albidus TaxID=595503 RepID=A0A9N9LQ22_9HELO|nr:hypothetical protein HYALB_00012293 [Hymenoscyphus albidus]
MRHNLFLILCLLSSLTCNTLALPWDGPRATKLARARIPSIAEPTTPPDLARRRDLDVGNPAFCGFGDAEKDNPWQCADDKKTCMLYTDLKVQGCCDTLKKDAKCDLYTGCKDGDSRTNPGVDPLMLLCKDKSLTCATITYTSKFVQYHKACVTDPSALPKTIDSTYKKQPKDAKTADLYMVGKKELGDPASSLVTIVDINNELIKTLLKDGYPNSNSRQPTTR